MTSAETGEPFSDHDDKLPLMERTNLRFQSEKRQYAGLLMLTGFCAVLQPLANIVSGVDAEDGPIATNPSEVSFWQFVGACCLLAIGMSSMLAGFLEFVHDRGSPVRYTLLIILTQVGLPSSSMCSMNIYHALPI